MQKAGTLPEAARRAIPGAIEMQSHATGSKHSSRLKAVHGNSLRKAFHEIRELIVHGKLSPGSWVVEGDLARHLAMSRTPVRSALAWLQREGYVTVRDHRAR